MGIQITPKREKLTDPQTVFAEEMWPDYWGVVNQFDREEYNGQLDKK